MFTDTIFETLDQSEQAAVYAHELAHLEQIARTRRPWREWALIGALILTGTVGPLIPGASLWMVLVWLLVVVFVYNNAAAQSRKREEASDGRAIDLCGDAAALERALVKLTVLARLPRRWSLDVEAGATHPSLARRIRAIRALAGGAVTSAIPAAGTAVVVNRAAAPIVFGPSHLEWTAGGTLHRSAYGDLVDIRIAAGLGARPALHITEVLGRTWRVALEPDAVSEVQAALDQIDIRLGTLVNSPETIQRTTRLLAVALLTLGWLPPMIPMIGEEASLNVITLAAVAAGVFAPGLTALVAVAVAAGGSALFGAIRDASVIALMLSTARGVVAAAAIIVGFRARGTFQSLGSRIIPIALVGLSLLWLVGPLTAYVLWREEGAYMPLRALRSLPDAWLIPLAWTGMIFVAAESRWKWLAAVPRGQPGSFKIVSETKLFGAGQGPPPPPAGRQAARR